MLTVPTFDMMRNAPGFPAVPLVHVVLSLGHAELATRLHDRAHRRLATEPADRRAPLRVVADDEAVLLLHLEEGQTVGRRHGRVKR